MATRQMHIYSSPLYLLGAYGFGVRGELGIDTENLSKHFMPSNAALLTAQEPQGFIHPLFEQEIKRHRIHAVCLHNANTSFHSIRTGKLATLSV